MFDNLVAILLRLTDAAGAVLLAAVLLTAAGSAMAGAPLGEIAVCLLLGLGAVGAAGALARGDFAGTGILPWLPAPARRVGEALATLAVLVAAAGIAAYALQVADAASGLTIAPGVPLDLALYPMAGGAICLALFALFRLDRHDSDDLLVAGVMLAAIGAGWRALAVFAPDRIPDPGPLMLAGFVVGLAVGVPVAFCLALAALIFVWTSGALPGADFAQQMASGTDASVLLAVPFLLLAAGLTDAGGLPARLAGSMRGRPGIVAVPGTIISACLAPGRSNPGPGGAAVAVGANIIILGATATLSVGGLFLAGLLPTGLIAAALAGGAVLAGDGDATVGTCVRASPGGAMRALVSAATRSGLVLFTVAAAQSVAYALSLQHIPQAIAGLSSVGSAVPFMLLSIALLIVTGRLLRGTAALVVLAPMLLPVASGLGIAPLRYGVVTVIAIGLAAPGRAPARTLLRQFGLLLACLLLIAFVPGITLWLPRALGY